jgi:phytoene dehydrogenase-like protein
MGAISSAIAASARAAGASIRSGAPVASIDVDNGRVTGVTLVSGETIEAPMVFSGAHPKRTVLDLVGAEHFPEEVGEDMRRYRSRGGSVKINAVLSEPPRYVNAPDDVSEQLLHASVAIAPSVPYLERAWQDATLGRPAEGPYIEVEVPTSIDPSLTDDGTTVLTMFTQYGPHAAEDWPDGAREAYAERCFDILAEHAPNVRDAIIHYAGSPRRWRSCAWRSTANGGPASSPAASSSALRWRARSCSSRQCSCSTSRSERSTRAFGSTCRSSSNASRSSSRSPSSTSRTTRTRR